MAYENTIHSRTVVKTPEGFPTKLYNFRCAFDSGAFPDQASTRQYLLAALHQELLADSQRFAFAIGAAWGFVDKDSRAPVGDELPIKALDLFLYSKEDNWKTNPEVTARVYQSPTEARRVDNPSATTCESSLIILGEEGKLRRRTLSLDAYMEEMWPDIRPLGPMIGVTRRSFGLPVGRTNGRYSDIGD